LHRAQRRLRAKRRPKPLVAALVAVDRSDDFEVERFCGFKARTPVVGKRCIDRQPPCRGLDREPFEPFGRHQVEQSRGGDELQRPVEGDFKVTGEIDRGP
jgi:hypothetical protein